MTVYFCLFYYISTTPARSGSSGFIAALSSTLSPDSHNWAWWRYVITHVFSNFLISLVAFGTSKILSSLQTMPVSVSMKSSRTLACNPLFFPEKKTIVAFYFNTFLCCTQSSCSRVSLYRWHSTIRLFQGSCRPRLHQDTFSFPFPP